MIQRKFLQSALLGAILVNAIAPGTLSHQPLSLSTVEFYKSKQLTDNLPPPPQNPSRTTGGGRRGDSLCPQDAKTSTQSLIALSPSSEPGATSVNYPTFFVSVPPTRAQRVEFSLFDQNRRGIYQTTFALTGTPGIIRFTLPSNAPALMVGSVYTWVFALICDPADRRRDRPTAGAIRYTPLNLAQRQQIERATPRERVALYRQAGIWYETISLLVEQQRSQPTDPTLATAWKTLLQSGGLDPAALQPVQR